jgi:hypothetical protein
MLNGIERTNITSEKIQMDFFFKTFNEIAVNWLSFVYFEITKFGIEQI